MLENLNNTLENILRNSNEKKKEIEKDY